MPDMNSSLQAMRDLLNDDNRFKFEAYQFIREALQFAHENQELLEPDDVPGESHADGDDDGGSADQPKSQHVTGQQLCEACRRYGAEQYGYMAKMVLANWGIKSTSDFGELVYNLIGIEQMKKSDTDRREDFDDVYSFDDAFEPQFEYSSRDDD